MSKLDFTASPWAKPSPCVALPARYSELSADQRRRVREQYAALQGGLCWACREPLLGDPPAHVRAKPLTGARFPRGFFKWPEHLHHDHKTDLTIGTVHAVCNAVLFIYEGQ